MTHECIKMKIRITTTKKPRIYEEYFKIVNYVSS